MITEKNGKLVEVESGASGKYCCYIEYNLATDDWKEAAAFLVLQATESYYQTGELDESVISILIRLFDRAATNGWPHSGEDTLKHFMKADAKPEDVLSVLSCMETDGQLTEADFDELTEISSEEDQ